MNRAEVEAAMARLGDGFEKGDLCQALGYEPHRSSLHRVIEEMLSDGALEVESALVACDIVGGEVRAHFQEEAIHSALSKCASRLLRSSSRQGSN